MLRLRAGATVAAVSAPNGTSDLLRSAQTGDVAAFEAFYLETVEGLLAWFRRRTAAGDIAADLCAETYAAVWTNLDRYDPVRGSGPSAWLYGIAKNELRDYVRRQQVADRARRRMGVVADAVHDDDLDLVAVRVDLEGQVGPLRDAVSSLSTKLRDAVLLRVVDELPYAEVGRRAGCSEVAARARVARGLTQMWDQLGEGARHG